MEFSLPLEELGSVGRTFTLNQVLLVSSPTAQADRGPTADSPRTHHGPTADPPRTDRVSPASAGCPNVARGRFANETGGPSVRRLARRLQSACQTCAQLQQQKNFTLVLGKLTTLTGRVSRHAAGKVRRSRPTAVRPPRRCPAGQRSGRRRRDRFGCVQPGKHRTQGASTDVIRPIVRRGRAV